MRLVIALCVLALAACSSAKKDVLPVDAVVATQVDGTACPNVYDPLPLNRTDGKGTMLQNITDLPQGTYEYNGSSIFVFMETSKGTAKAHFVETPKTASTTTVQEICGINSIGDGASFAAESLESYVFNKSGKTLVGRQYRVSPSVGHFVLSTNNNPYQADTDLTVVLQKSSATAIYELSPTQYEFRSYVRATEAGKTEHIEVVTEFTFTPAAN